MGAYLLRRVLRDADACFVTVTLEAVACAGPDQARLVAWYLGFGFVDTGELGEDLRGPLLRREGRRRDCIRCGEQLSGRCIVVCRACRPAYVAEQNRKRKRARSEPIDYIPRIEPEDSATVEARARALESLEVAWLRSEMEDTARRRGRARNKVRQKARDRARRFDRRRQQEHSR